MLQIESVASGRFGVEVDHRNLTDHAAALEGKTGARANQPAAANDGNFHNV